MPLNTLGILERIKSPYFTCPEWHRRVQTWNLLVGSWPVIQGGEGKEALDLWRQAVDLLELDDASIEDLMLLVNQGPAGRAEGNEILWTLLAEVQFAEPRHRDLSRKASSLITIARKRIDRPPHDHQDRRWWTWKKAIFPRDPVWAASAVPKDARMLVGPRGRPLRPPACWAPPPPPADTSASSSSWAPGPPGIEVPPAEGRAGRPRRFA